MKMTIANSVLKGLTFNVLVSSFRFTQITMLWVYGHYYFLFFYIKESSAWSCVLLEPWRSGRAAYLESRISLARTSLWAFKFQRNKVFLPRSLVKIQYCEEPLWLRGSVLGPRLQGSNFESCVWRAVSSHSSHHPQEVLLAQFNLYVHKGGLKPHSFHFICLATENYYFKWLKM